MLLRLQKFFIPISFVLLLSCNTNTQGVSTAEKVTLIIQGSDKMKPLLLDLAVVFKSTYPNYEVHVTAVDSNPLVQDTSAVAMFSIELTHAEKKKRLKNSKVIPLEKVVIAHEPICVIVNTTNHVDSMGINYLRDIYLGKIKTWELNGHHSIPIKLCTRDSTSGISVFFKENVLKGKPFAKYAIPFKSSKAIVSFVERNATSIGYVAKRYVTHTVKPLSIALDSTSQVIDPKLSNIVNSKHQFTRPLFMYYSKKSKEKVKDFVNFIMSNEGDSLMMSSGYIPES